RLLPYPDARVAASYGSLSANPRRRGNRGLAARHIRRHVRAGIGRSLVLISVSGLHRARVHGFSMGHPAARSRIPCHLFCAVEIVEAARRGAPRKNVRLASSVARFSPLLSFGPSEIGKPRSNMARSHCAELPLSHPTPPQCYCVVRLPFAAVVPKTFH